MLLKELARDGLKVRVYDSREDMGRASAEYAIDAIRKLLEQKDEINIVFGAAPSQNELLEGLVKSHDVDFTRINAYHMDEYLNLDKDAPQMFGNFLDRHIFKLAPFKSVNYVHTGAGADEECKRYTELLLRAKLDISLVGIGENGHIAFNDPHTADFNDEKLVKVVTLDDRCRQQQVNDGNFAKFDDVPSEAITLTIPVLMSAEYVICTVPTAKKREAVTATVNGEIGEKCPATIMRRHANAILFVDGESGKDLLV